MEVSTLEHKYHSSQLTPISLEEQVVQKAIARINEAVDILTTYYRYRLLLSSLLYP